VTLALLAERSFGQVRAFASARSAGSRLPYGDGELAVEEATPAALAAGELDLCFFSVGTSPSSELVPAALRGGAVCVDKSSAFRLVDGVPLVVPEVNGERTSAHDGIVANPNCSTIQLVCALAPLREAAGLRRVRVATYQSASGAGVERMEELRAQTPEEGDVVMDWEFEGDDSDEESKLRAETRKILELPELPLSATCARVPVLVGHSQAVWVETEEPLPPGRAREVLEAAPGVRVTERPTAREAAGGDEVLVGRIRADTAGDGLALWIVCDNLRKGAALNAIQIAELLLERRAVAA
jgi:aspartate-semialdehyde dehydrogenase